MVEYPEMVSVRLRAAQLGLIEAATHLSGNNNRSEFIREAALREARKRFRAEVRRAMEPREAGAELEPEPVQ